MHKILMSLLLTVALITAACQPVPPDANETVVTEEEVVQEETEAEPIPATVTVEVSVNGMSPQDVTIHAGDTVTWTNKKKSSIRIASNVHPTHDVYPGTNASLCGTDIVMFDSCTSIASGESWSFAFTESGTWRYHDHLAPTYYGTVTVE